MARSIRIALLVLVLAPAAVAFAQDAASETAIRTIVAACHPMVS